MLKRREVLEDALRQGGEVVTAQAPLGVEGRRQTEQRRHESSKNPFLLQHLAI